MDIAALLVAATLTASPVAQPETASRGQARWPKGAVILVWIDPAGAPPGAHALVERAMKTWTDAAGGRFRLGKTAVRETGGLRVRFVRNNSNYGETLPRIDRRTGSIVEADVVITASLADDPLDARIVTYLTALHELGHALGLAHSDDFGDIMYRFRRPDDGERYFMAYRKRLGSAGDIGSAQATGLSMADVDALRRLYDRR